MRSTTCGFTYSAPAGDASACEFDDADIGVFVRQAGRQIGAVRRVFGDQRVRIGHVGWPGRDRHKARNRPSSLPGCRRNHLAPRCPEGKPSITGKGHSSSASSASADRNVSKSFCLWSAIEHLQEQRAIFRRRHHSLHLWESMRAAGQKCLVDLRVGSGIGPAGGWLAIQPSPRGPILSSGSGWRCAILSMASPTVKLAALARGGKSLKVLQQLGDDRLRGNEQEHAVRRISRHNRCFPGPARTGPTADYRRGRAQLR